MQENQSKLIINDIIQPSALKFVILLGVVSLLSDVTYEGARSIKGPFLVLLGGWRHRGSHCGRVGGAHRVWFAPALGLPD